ncbi:hypothetical protein C900_04973 [Fulvivirga imtechensis AK7]|uniref:Lipoprotein n=1 Tax=Fulvivirga imtechensis AK7 TaxID=1237149 RepID=L8JKJ0_9BACT|nr:hypothetical protein C900_04973 [Fulvivirga imtechensis AK7]
MKVILKFVSLLIVGVLLLTACGPRPQYKTRVGKKKLKHYNSIQYGQTEPKTFKSFKRQK